MKMYLRIVAVLFLVIAIAHLLRLALDSSIIIDKWQLPMWVSYFGLCFTGVLSILGFKYARKAR